MQKLNNTHLRHINEFQNAGEFIVKIPEKTFGWHYVKELYLIAYYQDFI